MKYLSLLFLLFKAIFCNAQFTESFDDGDFTQNPTWKGDSNLWQVSQNELQSNSQTANQQFYLSTTSNSINETMWEFDIKLNFNTSSTNFLDVFLATSDENLLNPQKGYFIRIGNTADEISLYRKDSNLITKIIDGKDARTNSSSNQINIKVWKDANHLWQLFSDTTFTRNLFYKEGEIIDSTYTSSSFFGVLARQSTASFFNKHFLDNIIIQPYFPDNSPPILTNISVLNTSKILLSFNENIDFNFLQKGQFLINNIPSDSFKKGNFSHEILLYFKPNFFVSKNNYHLHIDSLPDINQNYQINIDTSFFYFSPTFRDIRITEFFPDPTPIIALPEAEFVEIWNASDYPISLKNWKIYDNSTTFAILPDYTLQNNDYIIICSQKDTALFSVFGNTIGVSSLPNLNNDADEIKLYNSQNEIIDSVFYNISFYKDNTKKDGGWSIEMINPKYPCKNIAKNFAVSQHSNGGTPGKTNSIWHAFTDSAAPQLLEIITKSTDEIILVFDSETDSLQLTNAQFILSENSVINSKILNSFGDSVLLTLQNPQAFDLQKTLVLTIDLLSDCWGNTNQNIQKNFVHFLASPPKFSEIIITEIMSDPDPVLGLPNAEYIEIYNTSDLPIQLQNTKLSGVSYFPNFILQSKTYLLITSLNSVNLFPDSIQKIGLSNFPTLSNSGQTIYLISPSSEIIHQVTYDNNWHSNGVTKNGGWSLEILDISNPCQTENNWKTSQNTSGGTPGFVNSYFEKITAENTPKLVRIYPVNNAELWLYFDKIIKPNSFQNNDFLVTKNIDTPYKIDYLDNSQKNLKLSFVNTFQPEETFTLEVHKIQGCLDSNMDVQKMDFGIMRLADTADITINEILFNPFTAGVDFVEIYNKSSDYLDLKNLLIANTDLSGNIDVFSNIAVNGFMLTPHEFLAISENNSIIKSQYPNTKAENLWQINSLPSYNDDAGTCVILDVNLTEFDRYSYTKKMHHPSIDNSEGISLEKINPLEKNIPNFWTSTSSLIKATPGYQNSQFMKTNIPKGTFSLSTPTVSPDGDAFEDIVYFQYKMIHAAFTGTIEIFDIHGVKKRTLINNELLETEGNILFDGTDNYGNILPPGIYPIFFSYYDVNGNLGKIKSSIVVAVKF